MEAETRKVGFVGYTISLIIIAMTAHFSYAAIQGPLGLLSLFKVESQEARLIDTLDQLHLEYAQNLNRAHRLSDGFLDLDLLDERARKVLGYARGNEIIIQ